MLFPKDSKVSAIKNVDSIELKWHWYHKDRSVFVLNTLMFLALGTLGLLVPDKPGQSTPPFANLMFWFFLSTMVPGMALFAATWFINESVIRCNSQFFRIHSAPFPWVKAIEIPSERITQFFVTHSGHRNRNKWTLYCLEADSNYRLIGQYFPSEFAAHQICHELQDWYGLEDLPVFGQNTLPHQPGPRSKKCFIRRTQTSRSKSTTVPWR